MCKFSHVLYYVADDDLEDRNVQKNDVLKYYMSFLHYQVTTKEQTQWISIVWFDSASYHITRSIPITSNGACVFF